MEEGQLGLVQLEGQDQGLAPGQYAAFYSGSVCLGSGIILEPPASAQEGQGSGATTGGGLAKAA